MIVCRAVDRSELPEVWPLAAPALRAADLRSRLGDIGPDLERGRKRLWLAEENGLLGAAVTCVTDFPAKRVCTILLCGGTDLDRWQSRLQGLIEEHARWEGCAEIEIIGRPGWHRKCPDYELTGAWLVKELS